MKLFKSLNTSLHEYDEIFIWGTDIDARNIFISCLQQQFKIDGFITEDEKLHGLKFFNRPVIHVAEFGSKEKTAILAQKRMEILTDMQSVDFFFVAEGENLVYQYADFTDKGRVVIWGCGPSGMATFEILKQQGKNNLCFTDSNKAYWGKQIEGYPIISVDEVLNSKEKITVVLALSRWKEVFPRLQDRKNIRIYVDIIEHENKYAKLIVWDDKKVKEWNPFFRDNINMIYEVFYKAAGRTIIFIGKEWWGVKIKKIFDLCGARSIIVDSVYDILYYDTYKNYFVFIDNDIENEIFIYNNGYIPGDEYTCLTNGTQSDIYVIEHTVYDVFLGRTYHSAELKHGITKLGRDNAKIKILILGGSTTDAKLYHFKEWSRCLYELMEMNNIDAQIINMGYAGATSYQEVFRLKTEGLTYKPDIVISYSGVNDYSRLKYKKLHDSVLNAFRYYSRVADVELYFGQDYNQETFEPWYANEEKMHSICKENNIEFIACMQPYAFVNETGIPADAEFVLNYMQKTGIHSSAYEFLEKGRAHTNEKWLVDMTNIFENESSREIFMDFCHVTEKGNYIIAKKMLEVLKERNLISNV